MKQQSGKTTIDAKALKKLGFVSTAKLLEEEIRKTRSNEAINALYVLLTELEDDKEMYNEVTKVLNKGVLKCVIDWADHVNDTIFPLSMKNNTEDDNASEK